MNTTTLLRLEKAKSRPAPLDGVKVWDLPTRLFHWALATCVAGAVVTAQLGGNWMDWHLRLGIATLGLLGFRLVWGLAGPRYARFGNFLYTPRAAWQHLREVRSAARHVGHSPSGAASVFALLAVLAAQVATGLFSSDSISTEGPLVAHASEAVVSWSTWLHLKLQWVIYGMVALHVIAVVAYLVVKKDNLIAPMVTGRKHGIHATPAADGWRVRIGGALGMAAALGLAFWWLR